jgi:hypothetical protein
MARVGYMKIGRTIHFDPNKWGFVGGDDEPPLALLTLARRNPQHQFIIVGLNSGWEKQAAMYPPNVINPWTEMHDVRSALARSNTSDDVFKAFVNSKLHRYFFDLDALIVWAGQSGTSNTAIPKVGSTWESGDLVTPLQSQLRHSAYATLGINAFRERDPLKYEEIWLNPDPRNVPKMRDLKWPQRYPILTQFNFTETRKFERYTDMRSPQTCGFDAEWEGDHLWRASQSHKYSRLEICGILPEHIGYGHQSEPYGDRRRFGLFINEARTYVTNARRPIIKEWVLPLEPDFIHGKWDKGHEADLGREITPAPWSDYYPLLRSVRSTFTTPSSGSGWATTKPWQAFATRTVCFFHPQYDTQDNILGDLPTGTRNFLRVKTPDDLRERVDKVNEDHDLWEYLTDKQYELYRNACDNPTYAQLIEERING